MTKKVNPIHFKPTWALIRCVDEADVLLDTDLALSDAEMLATRVAVSTFIKMAERLEDRRSTAMSRMLQTVERKLEAMLDLELEEPQVETNGLD